MISVVIPLYNKENSIATTINSVLIQTFYDFEIVVVDDGSTDNSALVVEKLCDRYRNIHLIKKHNGGVSSARNTGIRESKGEYIAFLDADDLWHPDYLFELNSLIQKFPDVGIYELGYKQIQKEEFLTLTHEENSENIPYGIVSNPWDEHAVFWTGSSSSSKAALIEVGLFDERISHGEDLDMWYRLLLYKGGAFSKRCLAYYVQDADNRAMNEFIPFEKHLPFFIEKYSNFRKGNVEFRKYFDEQCLYRLFPYVLIKDYRKDLKRVLSQIDFSLQKKSMRYRFLFPRMYIFYKHIIKRQWTYR